MRNISITLYKFNELPAATQSKIVSKNNDIAIFDDWYKDVYEEFKELDEVKNSGFEIDKIYFTGFSSQGDGAMFEGGVTDIGPFLKLFTPPVNDGDQKIIDLITMEEITITCSIIHDNGRYYHSNSANFYVCVNNEPHDVELDLTNIRANIIKSYRTLCDTLYKMLERAYDGMTTIEYISEYFMANEYEFYETGKIYINQG
jgi:hypothetical protein